MALLARALAAVSIEPAILARDHILRLTPAAAQRSR